MSAPRRAATAPPARARAVALLPFVASALFALVFIARGAFTLDGAIAFSLFDDGMISMQYARNLVAGHGLVWNAGEAPVEGYTNLLWTLGMALAHLLPVSEARRSLVVMVAGEGLLLADIAVVGAIARRLMPAAPVGVAAAMWLTALCYPLIYWTLRGMEVGFVALVLAVAVLLTLRLRDRFRGGDLALLALTLVAGLLTRTDVAIPAGIIVAALALLGPAGTRARAALGLGATLAATLGAHTAFRLAYYHHALPNTYTLKMGGVALTTRLGRGVESLLVVGAIHLLPLVLLALWYFLARRRAADPAAALLAALVLGQVAYAGYVGGDAWEWMGYANRYLSPALPLRGILAVLGILALVDRAPGTRPARAAALLTLPCVAVVLLTLIARAAFRGSPLSVQYTFDQSLTRNVLNVPAPLLGTVAMLGYALFVAAILWQLRPRATGTGAGRERAVGLAVVALALATLVATDGQTYRQWFGENAFSVAEDGRLAVYGRALGVATAPGTTIAVSSAGAITYFSGRPTVDLLGKSDYTVASGPPATTRFMPGHNKWHYAYSIGVLRPAVIAQLFGQREGDVRAVEDWGYERVAPYVFVRADATTVDRAAIARAAAALACAPTGAGDPGTPCP